MPVYQYSSLVGRKNDLRLLDLLPGGSEDPITVRIRHVTLELPSILEPERMDMNQLQESLPSGWRAYQTLFEGRYIFVSEANWDYYWTHPDPKIDESSYQLPLISRPIEAPVYEALSYTWGSPENQQKIRVKSEASTNAQLSELSIQKNLSEALYHLRYTENVRTLWVDAVCINQKDDQERNEQVLRMADIYSCASRVVVWLGLASKTSHDALSVLSHIGKQCEFSTTFVLLGHPEATEEDWHSGKTNLPYEEDDYLAVAELIKRPWFSRLWVVQEVQLANSQTVLQCGGDEILWNEFSRALHCLNEKSFVPPLLKSLIGTQLFLIVLNSDLSFPTLVYRHWGRLCSDNRDKIYALLGLTQANFRQTILPQYSDSLGVVFRDAFLACIEVFHRLEFLAFCYSLNRKSDIPSWVPDLSIAKPGLSHLGNQFSAGYSRAHTIYRPPNILEVTGVFSHTIESVSPLAPTRTHLMLEHIRSHVPKMLAKIGGECSVPILETLARTLVVDVLRERFPHGFLPTLGSWMSDVEVGILNCQDFSPAGLSYFNEWSMMNLTGRPFFTTEDGNFGLGPPETKSGDIICVILGTQAPIVLRPEDNSFRVVGECFVSSLSDAMALLGPLPEPWKVVCTHHNSKHGHRFCYFNSTTAKYSFEDPRFEQPLNGWKSTGMVLAGENSRLSTTFQNVSTGEVVNSDPRFELEYLRTRGVALRNFALI